MKATVREVESAAAVGDCESSFRTVVDWLLGCWDRLLIAKKSLLTNLSTDVIFESAKFSAQGGEETLHLHASCETLAQRAVGSAPAQGGDGPYERLFDVNTSYPALGGKNGLPQYDRIKYALVNTHGSDDIEHVSVTSVCGEGGAGKVTTRFIALGDVRGEAQLQRRCDGGSR